MTSEDSIPLTAPVHDGTPANVLALHCGEGAIRAAFDELLARLRPGEACDRVSLPGGAWWLAQAADLSEGRLKRLLLGGRVPVRDAIDAMLSSASLREVVLLGHQECAWYRQQHPRDSPGDLVRDQGADMLRARDEIHRWAPRRLAVTGWIVLNTADGRSARRVF